MIKKLKIILSLLTVCLVGAGGFYFLNGWNEDLIQASLNSEEQNLVILNPNSRPQAGDSWIVSFETKGAADLIITPTDQQSIDDLDFISLSCDREERTPQILENDIIFYPNWSCEGTGKITHVVNVTGKHILKFQFGDKTAYAYNNPDSVTDYFDTTNPDSNPEYYIASKENLVVSADQVILATLKVNGTACSSGSECESGYCVDGVCCNTACNNQTCERCDSYSNAGAGTCGYISTAVDPDNECGTTGCLTDNCKGDSYACGYYTSGDGNCPTCQTCVGATNGSCLNYAAYNEDSGCTAQCTGCSGGSCVNIPDGSQDTWGASTCTDTHYRCDGNAACTAPTTSTCVASTCSQNYCTDECSGYDICAGGYGSAGCTGWYNSNCGAFVNFCSCLCKNYVYD